MGMTGIGWLFLVLAWTFIFSLMGFCLKKIMASGDTTFEHPEKTKGPGSAPGA